MTSVADVLGNSHTASACALYLCDFEFVNNDCFSVPDELAELRDLRHLNFGSTQIGTIPDAVLELPRLKSLLLTGTNFTAERARHVKLRFPKAVVRPIAFTTTQFLQKRGVHEGPARKIFGY